MSDSVVEKYVSEFVGTFLLVLTVSCNVLAGNAAWGATSIACVLMVSIYALGSVSGAHFNPAVTLAVTLSNKFEGGAKGAVIYMIMQLLGGTFGAVVGFTLFGKTFNLAPSPEFNGTHAAIVEILYTFMLCFVVLNVACTKASSGNQYYGLAIGFVIVAGGYAAGSVSGAAFNPAVALGVDLASVLSHGFGWSLAYVVFQFVGAACAAGVYLVVRPEEFGGEAKSIVSKLVSEFLGTFFLVLTVGLNVLSNQGAAAYSIAASLMVWIYAVGNVSGGHFNPAVTVAVLLSGRNKITPNDAILYIGTQLIAGVVAGFTYFAVHGKIFGLGPGLGHSWGSAAVAEAVFTAVLCFVVLHVATTKDASKDMFGLAIGSCVTVGGFAIGGVSGGSLNPAVSFGIDASHSLLKHEHFGNSLPYAGFELVGAAVAAGAFYVTKQSEFSKEFQPLV